MEAKKQTAVEWLADQIQEQLNVFLPGAVLDEMMLIKAKQMEREQIMDAHLKGQREDIDFINEAKEEAEQYYNETYGKDKSET